MGEVSGEGVVMWVVVVGVWILVSSTHRMQDTTLQQRDLQRLQHIADCQQLLYSIAQLLHVELPARPSCSPTFSLTPTALWESVGSLGASVAEKVSFDDWVQTVDMWNASAVHVVGKAITQNPAAFRNAWSSCKHETCFAAQLKALVLILTGHALSSAQVSLPFRMHQHCWPTP